MPHSSMPSKFAIRLKLLLSSLFLFFITGTWEVLSSFYETDAFVIFAYAVVVGFFLCAAMADAYELTKYRS
jgi:hypothetical protein